LLEAGHLRIGRQTPKGKTASGTMVKQRLIFHEKAPVSRPLSEALTISVYVSERFDAMPRFLHRMGSAHCPMVSRGTTARPAILEGKAMQAFRTKSAGAAASADLLLPDRAQRQAASATRRADYVDVEFETVAATARRTPYPVFNDTRQRSRRSGPRLTVVRDEQAAGGRFLSLAEARLRAMPPRQFAGLVAAFALAAFAGIIALSTGDQRIQAPLAISDITTSLDYSGGMRVLSVYGAIDNSSSGLQRLPLIVVDVISNGRKVTATRLLPEGAAIAPGESRRFVTRLPYAGGKMPEVKVSFAENGVSVR